MLQTGRPSQQTLTNWMKRYGMQDAVRAGVAITTSAMDERRRMCRYASEVDARIAIDKPRRQATLSGDCGTDD